MSAHSVVEALAGANLHDCGIALIAYDAHARKLVLRIETRADSPGGARLRTLIFDGVIGLHCDPPAALAPFGDKEDGEILRLDTVERPNTEPEVTLVYLRWNFSDAPPAVHTPQVVTFRAMDARWVG
jgi:hypothetical protein